MQSESLPGISLGQLFAELGGFFVHFIFFSLELFLAIQNSKVFLLNLNFNLIYFILFFCCTRGVLLKWCHWCKRRKKWKGYRHHSIKSGSTNCGTFIFMPCEFYWMHSPWYKFYGKVGNFYFVKNLNEIFNGFFWIL